VLHRRPVGLASHDDGDWLCRHGMILDTAPMVRLPEKREL
jgi:hypothetical protein